MKKISDNQKLWLLTRGGRDEKDIFYFKNKPCIFMRSKKEWKLTPIPKEEYLKFHFDYNGYCLC